MKYLDFQVTRHMKMKNEGMKSWYHKNTGKRKHKIGICIWNSEELDRKCRENFNEAEKGSFEASTWNIYSELWAIACPIIVDNL